MKKKSGRHARRDKTRRDETRQVGTVRSPEQKDFLSRKRKKYFRRKCVRIYKEKIKKI